MKAEVSSLRNKVAIVGIGEINGSFPDKDSIELKTEAIIEAMNDAGLKKQDVDGLIGDYSAVDDHREYTHFFMEQLNWFPRYSASIKNGGCTPLNGLEHAASAIATGMADTVAIMYGDNRRTGFKSRSQATEVYGGGVRDFQVPYGPSMPGCFAWMFQRHKFEYGTTREQLAVIPVTQRKHASMHPKATRRNLITIEDVLKAPIVADPLTALDSALVSDYAGAVIVTSAERAKALKKPPIYLVGIAEAVTHVFLSQSPTLTTLGYKLAGERVYAMAGVGPRDIDVAELYDAFSIAPLIQLEDFGFCKKGEGGPFVASGAIGLGGEIPMNTHGGNISFGGAGIFQITEAVTQLRGEAGDRQVEKASIALVSGCGAQIGITAAAILSKEII